ncbi:short-chain dehydrogenase/reductase family 16C member 6-like isoform X2 [Stegodyphus dumicola]|uniref:short-chain dehydrogenase/reductase family 16C member 6-like isoform X2 n=1 Tax=Stegodyphus dumicola TaxID=202533 RepID=UPI0015A8639B|nr:short-chain dehydrogenase/reductase family 16C member 6-like isoform X2 [Stegodyphus dumicola]
MASSFTRIVSNLGLLLYYWLESIVLAFIPKRLRYKDITGEVVLITGGGSGIGRLLATRFASHGAKIVVWDLNLDAAEETVKIIKENGGEAYAYQCDVSKPQLVYDAAAKVKREVGRVNILVNNAGIVTGKRLLDCPDHMIQKTFEVNAISHFWTCKAFLPDMMADNHGHIVSIASMAGLSGVVRLTDYCASKFAAVGFEESLRLELYCEGYTGIHSTVVCPYYINTGMFEGAKPGVFTMMSPEYVADEIVSAVLVNQEVLLLPKAFNILITIKTLLPVKAINVGLATLEGRTLINLSGRTKQDVKTK